MKKIINILSTIMLVIAVVVVAALVGVRLFGLTPYAVLSGSMEPTYKTGSVVYVRKIDYHDLEVGDPITFMLSENTIATHRIVEILPDEDADVIRYVTKGDNSESKDANPVHCNNIIGKPVFSIPFLGYISNFIQNKPGKYITIVFCALVVLLAFMPDLLDDEKKKTSRGTQHVSSDKNENKMEEEL